MIRFLCSDLEWALAELGAVQTELDEDPMLRRTEKKLNALKAEEEEEDYY